MTGHPALQIIERPEGPTVAVIDRWDQAARDAFIALGNGRLELNYALGFKERDTSFLAGLPIEDLSILCRTMRGLGGIYEISGLKGLHVEISDQTDIDLGQLPSLTALSSPWVHVRRTIDDASPLIEQLMLQDFGGPDLLPLGHLRAVRELILKPARHLRSLRGVDQWPELTQLTIALGPDLADIDDLRFCRGLVELDLDTCKQIDDLSPLGELTNLRRLGLEDCGPIKSLAPLRSLQCLAELYAWESTRILDGDLTPLLDLPELRKVAMANRRTYQPTVPELKALLQARHAEVP